MKKGCGIVVTVLTDWWGVGPSLRCVNAIFCHHLELNQLNLMGLIVIKDGAS